MNRSASLALIVTTLAGAAFTQASSAAGTPSASRQPLGCLIQPDRVAEVGSPVVGVVESMLVERGDSVRKGQVIAVLRNGVDRASLTVAHSRARVEAEVRAASANLVFARQGLTRARELHNRKFISSQALDQAVAENEVAQQKLAQAEEQQRVWADEVNVARARLEDRTIRSPFDGVIAERYISAGERIEERPLVRVVKVDPLRIEVIMPGSLFGSVAAGSVARVTPDLAGAATVSAKVILVDNLLDAASGTFRVRLKLPNPGASIPAGLRCKIDFAAATKPVASTPHETGAGNSLNPVSPRIGFAAGAKPGTRSAHKPRADNNLIPVSRKIGFSAGTRPAPRHSGKSRAGASEIPIRLKLDLTLTTPRPTGAPSRDEI